MTSRIKIKEVSSFAVNDLTLNDLDKISWSGTSTHIRYVKEALERVEKGEVDYLAIRDEEGNPISIGGVDYKVHKDAGTMWQIITKESSRGLGIGTRLIKELENRIKSRNINMAMLGVEKDNTRAQDLYNKLGYKVCGETKDSWEQEDKEGKVSIHYADGVLMRKEI
ncbi:MAG: GNAT family N-acetyltransferase [bacterium]